MTLWNRGWGRFALQALVIGVVVFVAIRAARALEGVPNVSPRTSFTVSGHLAGIAGNPPGLSYVFHKSGFPDCIPPVVGETLDPSGNYSAQIYYGSDGDAGVGCAPGFFDGSNLTVDVRTGAGDGATTIVRGQPINPVPYAQFAANAGSAFNAADGGAIATALAGIPRVYVGNRNGADPFTTSSIRGDYATMGFLFPTLQAAPGSHVLVHASTVVAASGSTNVACAACIIFDGGSIGCDATGYKTVNAVGTDFVPGSFEMLADIIVPTSSTSTHSLDIQVASLTAGSTCTFGDNRGDLLTATVYP